MIIADNTLVRIDYTLRNDAGDVLDTSEGGPPLAYVHGQQQIVPGLEKALAGKSVGDQCDVVVPAVDGYGEHMAEGVLKLPRDFFPADAGLEVGQVFVGEDDEGRRMPVRVIALLDTEVQVDANHPLAGETLHFHVEIKEVREATKEELTDGPQ